jgi:hypothetical protein
MNYHKVWKKRIKIEDIMKIFKIVLLVIFLFLSANPNFSSEDFKYELPQAVLIEILRVEETYHVLDQVADQVWIGWDNYRDFPFLLTFENGLRVLIGHPEPPDGFELYPAVAIGDKKVYVDRRQENSIQLEQPLSCGGGVLNYGSYNGKPVVIVDMKYDRMNKEKESEVPPTQTENRVLIFTHELLHCFQRDHIKIQYGNLRYNPDANFAIYSEIEGEALLNAYQEMDNEKATQYLKDFLVAREIKRTSMTEQQQNEESSDELREGQAVYSEVRTLELLKGGYSGLLTAEKDTFYSEFNNIQPIFETYLERLENSKKESLEAKMRCYSYGCFQALLLQRFFTDWQKQFSTEGHYFDEVIRNKITISAEDRQMAKDRFKTVYDLSEKTERHSLAINKRDDAYKLLSNREGRIYVINFREIKLFISTLPDKEKQNYKLGLMNIFPEGIGSFTIDKIEGQFKDVPMEINQLYHIKLVDTEWKNRKQPYQIKFDSQEDKDVYLNAEITTPLFTIKAPKIRIKENDKRVKIIILSRV